MSVLGYHAIRSVASLASTGRVEEARKVAKVAEQMLKRARLVVEYAMNNETLYSWFVVQVMS